MADIPRFSLADLTARDLAEEMVRRIPAHAPEWTHAQQGDPGRALIDLVAWMGETILYRVNLLPRRQRLEFLRLIGLDLRQAEPARGLVSLAHRQPAGAGPAFVPAGTRLAGATAFETTGPITVQPFEGRAYYKRRLEGPEAEDLAEVIGDLAELYGIETADPYATTPLFADGRAVPSGLDPVEGSVDRTLWIALLALDDTAGGLAAARAAFDAQPALLSVGVIPRLVTPDGEEPPLARHFQWAISSRRVVGGLSQDIFLPLVTQDDTTFGLTKEGTLRIVLPGSAAVAAPENDPDVDLHAGTGDRPPRIDDPAAAARLVAWLRLRPEADAGGLPLSWLGLNAVTLDARETRRQVQIGVGTGRPAQVMPLPAPNVDRPTFALSVQEAGRGFVAWQAVEDLAALGRDDRGYVLDAEAGTVSFGDGLAGRRVAAGARVRVDLMRSGGGEIGNLPPGSLQSIEAPGLVAAQPAAMSGGREAETLEAGEMRVRRWLSHQDRCVAAEDYRMIALELDLARAEVLPRFRPWQQRSDTPGVVSVMALPKKPVVELPNPRPDRRLLDRVRAHLEPRRPLGTELFVIAPDYVPVGVALAAEIRDGHAEEEVVSALKAAVRAFLWPLAGGGRDGTGWPLGQAVMNLEVELIAARVPGVRTTAGVGLFAVGPAGFVPVPRAAGAGTGIQTLELEPWQLPELLQVDVAIGTAVPSAMADLGGGRSGGTPVPVVPEVC